jgi:hypothetical protein
MPHSRSALHSASQNFRYGGPAASCRIKARGLFESEGWVTIEGKLNEMDAIDYRKSSGASMSKFAGKLRNLKGLRHDQCLTCALRNAG